MAKTVTFYTYLSGKNATMYPSDIIQAYAGDLFLYLTQGTYYIEMYGAGGGGGGGTYKGYYTFGGGGSGAGFKGSINLITGMYHITVGLRGRNGAWWNSVANYNIGTAGTATVLKNLERNEIVVSCGGGGTQDGSATAAGGKISYNSTYVTRTPDLANNGMSNGNTGSHYASWGDILSGGLSLYDNTHNGYGRGGYAFHINGDGNANVAGTCASGLDGYFKINCAGKISSLAYNCKDLKLNNKYYSFSNTVVIPDPEPTVQIIEYKTPGTYTLTLPKSGSMYVEAYGAGGGACYSKDIVYNYLANIGRSHFNAGGGAGAGFKGYLTLSAGTYTIVVGAGGASKNANQTLYRITGQNTTHEIGTAGGATSFKVGSTNYITCNGGTAGKLFCKAGDYSNIWYQAGSGGAFNGTSSYYSSTPMLYKAGNDGNLSHGSGASSSVPSITAAKSLYDNSTTGYGAGGAGSTAGKNGYFRIDMLI